MSFAGRRPLNRNVRPHEDHQHTFMVSRPARTINRLHFTDLAPGRFEDLCLALVFPMHPWADIRHYGRRGSDGGVDILAKERLGDGVERDWLVQCRRYASATKATLKAAVDDAVARSANPPQVLLVVVACDVSRKAHEAYTSHAGLRGIATPLLWTASLLEARLYCERRDLLFAYFGVSTAGEARSRESGVVRNIALKKRLHRELLRDPKLVDWEKARRHPRDKFAISEVIVHSVDDTTYPNVDSRETGISGWFKLELWDFYFNGLEFGIRIDHGVIDDEGNWSAIEYGQQFDKGKYREIKMFRLARIPYSNIVEVDVEGDEYYPQPHLYCRFANGGEPYEGFRRVLIDPDYPWPMDPAKEFRLAAPNVRKDRQRSNRAVQGTRRKRRVPHRRR